MSRPGRLLCFPVLMTVFFLASARAGEEIGLYDYALSDLDGKEVTLAPYRGKILVAEFFATWCPPCRKDLPEVISLRESYPADRVAFVAISADGVSKTTHKLPNFIREAGVKVPVLVGGGIFVDKYVGVEQRTGREISLPQTYVFSAEGEILMRLVGDQKYKKRILAEELDRFLKEPSSGEAIP